MAFRVTRKTLNTTPQALFGSDDDDRIGASATLVAQAAGTVHLNHASDGTTSNSARVPFAEGDTFEVEHLGEQLYGYVASGTLDVDIIEQGV